LHHKTHLPVVVDPSHGTGHTYLVPDTAAAAVAAGADGLIVEVHPNPEQALSDGYQSLDFRQFDAMLKVCRRVADAVGKQIRSSTTARSNGPENCAAAASKQPTLESTASL
jgi:3-deoxy-7-phosphoheptulonate synthase